MELLQKLLQTGISVCVGLVATTALAAPLQVEVYNPGTRSVFPVSSEIVWGDREVALIDAQFQRNDAEELVQKIKATGKRLSVIFVSQGDPDFYFGLEVIHQAFPDARILASAPTVRRIAATRDAKLTYWGPVLKDQAPHHLITPQALQGSAFTVDGARIEVRGLDGANPERGYLWIPSLQTVLGGVTTVTGAHIWLADTPSTADREAWLTSLEGIAALHPLQVIPGHYLGAVPAGDAPVQFTAAYLRRFTQAEASAHDSAQLISDMRTAYPGLGREAALEFSARVIKG